MRWLLLLIAGCTPSGTCTMAACPAGGRSYKFCSTERAGSCRYLASDGSAFDCKSCSDCAAAASQITNWCGMASSTTGSSTGSSTGSTTGSLPTSCTFPQQTCGAGKKCVAMFDGSNWTGSCVIDGTAGAGQPCTIQQSPDTLLDDCRAGLVCDDLYGNFTKSCRKICSVDGECAPGERCGDLLYAFDGWGWCAPTCAPFSTAAGNCPSGMDCGETADDAELAAAGTESGFFLCKKTGAGAAFATCSSDADCGPNLWCGLVDPNGTAAECLPNCNDSHACPTPPMDGGASLTLQCHPLESQPQNAGYCLP